MVKWQLVVCGWPEFPLVLTNFGTNVECDAEEEKALLICPFDECKCCSSQYGTPFRPIRFDLVISHHVILT